MPSLWNDAEAAGFEGDLALRVYTSRLLGRDKSLVLYGGGNTSVKSRVKDIFGREEEVLYVKGSGGDLSTIDEKGFAPLRLAETRKLAELEELSDEEMVRQLRLRLLDPTAPLPSVEAIVHAILPAKFVDHSHADAVVSVVNTPDGENIAREIWGERMVYVPYVMPGFRLARFIFEHFPRESNDRTIGLILLNHGIFTFGATARESYERMIEEVERARRFLETRCSNHAGTERSAVPALDRLAIAQLRHDLSRVAGKPMIVAHFDKPRAIKPDVLLRGPATPDHVIRTKPTPMIGRDVEAFAKEYRSYFDKHARGRNLKMLDPAPRVILDETLGLLAAGETSTAANIAGEIYLRTLNMIEKSEQLGGWRPVPRADLFDVEYWDLEQAKLRRAGPPAEFAGEVVLVTGAASGIGRACAEAFLARGAEVVGLDIDPSIEAVTDRKSFLGVRCDVTDESQQSAALDRAVKTFGGLDMLVLNAGIFPKSCKIEDLTIETWRRVMAVNVDANVALMRMSHPLLKLAPRGGRVVVIGSKNVHAPGAGAAAYSASKAALNQLARVAALEWAGDGIRVNSLHPNAVFDTGIWTDEVLASRAKAYGLSVEEYKTNNLLKVEITSEDVAALAAALCGRHFAKTTGAQIPIDGGLDRVI